MNVTDRHLAQLLPTSIDRAAWVAPLNAALEAVEANTPARVAHFMAQALHESAHFSALEENLNYSAEALLRVFPTHFTAAEVATFARNPRAIANRAYSNRLGNGDEASGEGFRFRGRGIFQVTGRDNYAECGVALFADATRLVEYPEHLATPIGAAMSAAWYWGRNELNALADANDFDGVSDVINKGRKTPAIGDANGWRDRLACFNLCCAVFGA